MKITFVLPHADMAGGIRVAAVYADRLTRRGHQVTVVSTPAAPYGLRTRLRAVVRDRQILPSRRPTGPSHFDGLNVNHRVLARYRPVTDRDVPDADVVVATWWETAEWVANLSPTKGAKAYLVQHHEATFAQQPVERVKRTYGLPLHKITISRWLVDLLAREYGATEVSHVPNSVDMAQFNAPPRGRQTRPTVGLLYSPTPFKGCDLSLEAIRRATAVLPDLRLVCFSDWKPQPHLPLPPGTAFTHHPPQDQIAGIYRQCDVWLCGSRSEGFHLPPLEAMACRCPVVSTAVGGPMDVIRDGHNGFLVNVGDVPALTDRLLDVLRQPEQRWRAMSDAAYATACQYTWEDATDLLEEALELAIRRGGHARREAGRGILTAAND